MNEKKWNLIKEEMKENGKKKSGMHERQEMKGRRKDIRKEGITYIMANKFIKEAL